MTESNNLPCPNKQQIAVTCLRQCGINFVAVDFDDTLISKHTGGKWSKTSGELAHFVRPVFRSFLPLLMLNGINLAIVTFSKQVPLIQEVLSIAFPHLYHHITVCGPERPSGGESGEGKQRYMACAVYDITSANRNVQICRSTSLLIDDDLENVEKALKDHVRALYFDPDNPDYIIEEIISACS